MNIIFRAIQHVVDKKDFLFKDLKHDVNVAGSWSGEVGNLCLRCFLC